MRTGFSSGSHLNDHDHATSASISLQFLKSPHYVLECTLKPSKRGGHANMAIMGQVIGQQDTK